MFNSLFSEILPLLDNVGKCGTAGDATDDNMLHAHCMLIPEATNTESEYVVFIAFPLQQCLHERASMLSYTYIDCLVSKLLEILNCTQL
jgi:hypothetical protein